MNVNRLRTLCSEMYKTLNNLNPRFIYDIFQPNETNGPTQG